jgi:NTP pyrophosphatase (non-canonical NTP hydrolase)
LSGFNDLSHAETERLALLLEELGESQQAIGKILRHGYESVNPLHAGPPNRAALEREIGDVLAALDLMVDAGDLKRSLIETARRKKHERVEKYLHHQTENREGR